MSFTDELREKFLPAASTYIKARERDYSEYVKRLVFLNKRISTLENPRNRGRASGSPSYGELSRLVGRLSDLQEKALERNAKIRENIDKNLDTYTSNRNDEFKAVRSEAAIKSISDISGEINAGNYNFDSLAAKLGNANLLDEKKGPSERTLLALMSIKGRLKNEDDKAKIDEVMADQVKRMYPDDERFSNQTSIDPKDWLSKYYPDVGTTSEKGRLNRQKILANPKDYQGPEGVAGAFHNENVIDYIDHSEDITKYKKLLDGMLFDQTVSTELSSGKMTPEQISEIVQKSSPLEEVDGKIAFKADANEEEKKVFTKILANEGLKEGSDFNDLVSSNFVKNSVSGLLSPSSQKRQIAQALEQYKSQRDELIQRSVNDRNLTPAQISVLTNPLFTRTNFRRGPSGELTGTDRFTMPSVEAAGRAPAEAAPEATEAPVEATEATEGDVSAEDSGVPVIPGIINRIERAAERAKNAETTSDATVRMEEFSDVLEQYEDLPDSVKARFPTDFNEAVDDWLLGFDTKGASNTPARKNLEWERSVTQKGLLDRTPVTTMTVGQLVSRTNEAEYENTKRVLGFLDNPDSLGQNAAEGTNPLGTVGSDFLDASALSLIHI